MFRISAISFVNQSNPGSGRAKDRIPLAEKVTKILTSLYSPPGACSLFTLRTRNTATAIPAEPMIIAITMTW